jgi:homoserine O-acetyltransferase
MANDGGQTLAMGAIRMGARRLNISQNAAARAKASFWSFCDMGADITQIVSPMRGAGSSRHAVEHAPFDWNGSVGLGLQADYVRLHHVAARRNCKVARVQASEEGDMTKRPSLGPVLWPAARQALRQSLKQRPSRLDLHLGEIMTCLRIIAVLALLLPSVAAAAADYPAPKSADWIAPNFKFHTGDVMAQLKLHYTTVGNPSGTPVVVLHGSGGSAANVLTPAFAGTLFGPDAPLDATKYYIIIPDALGHGGSAKPSDGLKTKFPQYDYADMVDAQYRLLSEGLGIHHVRLIIGNSMGGMHVWLWGERYPDYMDALVPMASQPTAMASRNWMLRRMMLEIIRNDPDYKNGDYSTQPRSLKLAATFFGIATAGGTLNYQKLAPTRQLADKLVDDRLAAPMTADANDFLWQWGSSADYDASRDLDKIQATVLAINSADDERNPPETGTTADAMKKVKNGTLYLIPASAETSGHLTTGNAKFYVEQLRELLQTAPHRGM